MIIWLSRHVNKKMVCFNIKNLQVQFHRTYFNIYITETELVKSNLLATISWMSTEWSVSFEYRITGVVSSWGSIVHLTIGSNIVQMGQRTTAVFTLPNSQKLIFNTTLNDETNYICRSVENLELNRVYKIEVHQRYISNGNYRYFIKIDGKEVH